MLPPFYQTILEKYLTKAQLITLNMLIWVLQTQKQVKIERLAAVFPLPIQENSRRRHLQRFLKLNALSVVLLWLPIIKELLFREIKPGKQLIVALDRTQWRDHNVLMASAIYHKRSFPIFWELLDKDGASSLAEQQKVLRPVIRLLRRYKLVIIGDREFHSVELAQWLHRQNISFVFRQKKDTTFRQKRQKFQSLKSLEIKPGMKRFYQDIIWSQNPGNFRFNLAVYWKRKYKSKQKDEPLYLLTNLEDCQTTLSAYSKRFGIEAMFKDCKTGGYNLEDSKASPDRLVRLILLIALAMTAAWLQGKKAVQGGQEAYICRLSEGNRNRKRHSNFWVGLYGHNWIVAFQECLEWVEELIGCIPHKRRFYEQGLRAIKLIQQPF